MATWAGRGGSVGLLKLQAQLQHRLPWRPEPYTLALHLPPAAPGLPRPASEQVQAPALAPGALAPLLDSAALRDAPHRLQQWFGVGPFLLLTPDSYSGRVLEEEVRWCGLLHAPSWKGSAELLIGWSGYSKAAITLLTCRAASARPPACLPHSCHQHLPFRPCTAPAGGTHTAVSCCSGALPRPHLLAAAGAGA